MDSQSWLVEVMAIGKSGEAEGPVGVKGGGWNGMIVN